MVGNLFLKVERVCAHHCTLSGTASGHSHALKGVHTTVPGCVHGHALDRVTGDTHSSRQLEPSCRVEGDADRNEIATFADTRHHRTGSVARLETTMFTKVKLRPLQACGLEGTSR